MTDRRGRSALAAGFGALAQGRLAALLLAATLVPALLVASGLWPALRAGFGHTLAGDHVLRNDPLLAPVDVTDFFHEERAAISGTWNAAWTAALFGIVAQIFFAGGFVRSLGRPIPPKVGDFLEGSRRDFWHNVKCFLLFLVSAAVVIGIWISVVVAVRKRILEGRPPGDPAFLATLLAGWIVAVLLYAVLSLWHDFARAARRIHPAIGAWRAYGFARRRLSGRWPGAIGLFFFWLVLGGAGFALLFAVGWSIPAASAGGVLILFLVQIATLSVRPLVRVAAWGSYIALFDRASAPGPGYVASPAAPRPSDQQPAPPPAPAEPVTVEAVPTAPPEDLAESPRPSDSEE